MGTLEDNKAGYDKTAVNNMEGFKHADYLLLHGSGDDNVHFLNSASLLDKLTFAKVRGFRFRMFTDSAHSMSVRGANEMTRFLFEKFGERDRRGSGLRPSSVEALLEKE
jgi:dipeptidyl aminopeptidase